MRPALFLTATLGGDHGTSDAIAAPVATAFHLLVVALALSLVLRTRRGPTTD